MGGHASANSMLAIVINPAKIPGGVVSPAAPAPASTANSSTTNGGSTSPAATPEGGATPDSDSGGGNQAGGGDGGAGEAVGAGLSNSFLTAEIAKMVAFVHASPAATPGTPVMVPGEPEARSTAEREAQGVPIPAAVWEVS